MDIKSMVHNVIEDFVFAQVDDLVDSFAKENPDLCTCQRCRLDTACYVLNRISPHYVVSNRGVARVEQASIERQQKTADVAALIYEGIQRVNHNLRPAHGQEGKAETVDSHAPVFNVPTIVGRLFSGLNFSPISDAVVELRRNGKLVTMKDSNWQNPYVLVPNTTGTFTFWAAAIPAQKVDLHEVFEYAVDIETPGFEPLHHVFNIPVKSEHQNTNSFSMGRTFKLPDLYMFPPGGDEDDRSLLG